MKTKSLCFIIASIVGLSILLPGMVWAEAIAPPPPIIEPQLIPPIFAEQGTIAPCYTGCGGETAPVVNASYEQQVVELVNEVRADNGLPPLKRATGLDEAARYHAADMGQDDYFEHDTYDRVNGKLVWVCDTWARIRSYYPSPSGENIGAGYSTPQSVMSGWMHSEGHRNNILSTYSWEIGVGYYTGSGYWGRYWVQNFGRRSDVYPLVINREASTTTSRDVSLYVYGDWAEMRLRTNDDPWTDWQPFQTTSNWTLYGAAGEHTVWVEMRDGDETATSSDSIYADVPDIPPTSVSVSGPAAGLVGNDYTFTATVAPAYATEPIIYTWQAEGQPPVTHSGGLSDTVAFSWERPATRAITVTARNNGGAVVGSHIIVVSATPLTGVDVSGPTTGFFNTYYAFTASAGPVTATQPVTYVWQTQGQPSLVQTGDLSDVANLAWGITGTQTITIVAENIAGATVTATHAITIVPVPPIVASPAASSTLVYTDGQGNATMVSIPTGGVVETATLRYTPLTTTETAPVGLAFAAHAFILEAHSGITPVLTFAEPVTVTIHYSDSDVTAIEEISLTLYYRDGDSWVAAFSTCSPTLTFEIRHEMNRLATPLCRLGEFAMFGRQWRVYLPLVMRDF
jgi:uncharacterized protein YkwD